MNGFAKYDGKHCDVVFDHGQHVSGIVDAHTYNHMIEIGPEIIGVLLVESICESNPEKVNQ